MESEDIRIGIADYNVTSSPNKLITVGLGSCVGIALYDSVTKIGGLAHIMLPNSKEFSNVKNPVKFADLAIYILFETMQKKGANKRYIKAKIVGGASMFKFSDKNMMMNIGSRNSIAVLKTLEELKIPVISKDIGGHKGRTMTFNTADGVVQIKTVGMGITEI